MESHVENFEKAKAKKEWGLARLALEYRCLGWIETEGSDVPEVRQIGKVMLELGRGNREGAGVAAKYVSLLPLFLSRGDIGIDDYPLSSDALRMNSNSPNILALRGLVLF